jgi:hypothetical protein
MKDLIKDKIKKKTEGHNKERRKKPAIIYITIFVHPAQLKPHKELFLEIRTITEQLYFTPL